MLNYLLSQYTCEDTANISEIHYLLGKKFKINTKANICLNSLADLTYTQSVVRD